MNDLAFFLLKTHGYGNKIYKKIKITRNTCYYVEKWIIINKNCVYWGVIGEKYYEICASWGYSRKYGFSKKYI